jgi:hypothetical protein
MELILTRTYHAQGTNGIIYNTGKLLCATIELPWLNNARAISCIPEGRYRLKLRYSPKFNTHILITGVKDRALILIHPANNV